ncbi:hypothetical protein ABZ837_20510 [Streptomyces sp. NPDC047197]|uniref:hypothetical protein n=1 Tax=Streptomyces sp. NPDC047197 TaxID=3155477 RepID=UPI0033D7156B
MSHPEPIRPARLLPWAGPEGKPCYLISDDAGPVSRVADAMESVQLGLGRELLTYARETLAGTPDHELRFLAQRLTEALHDALRVAESRGLRLNQ